MAEEEDPGNTDRRPTPVRMAMEAGDPQAKDPVTEHREFLDPVGGQEWIARVSGRSTSGVAPLRTISLMEVTFFRVQEPDLPARRRLCQGESMDDLDDQELLRLLRTSRPHPPHASDPPARERRSRRDRPREGN